MRTDFFLRKIQPVVRKTPSSRKRYKVFSIQNGNGTNKSEKITYLPPNKQKISKTKRRHRQWLGTSQLVSVDPLRRSNNNEVYPFYDDITIYSPIPPVPMIS